MRWGIAGPDWVNDLSQEAKLTKPIGKQWGCLDPLDGSPSPLRDGIGGGTPSNCAYKHDVMYRGPSIDNTASQSGTNWTGWCDPDKYRFIGEFYEGRSDCGIGVANGDKLYGCYLYGINPDGTDHYRLATLTGLYEYGLEDSCDCWWRYDRGGKWNNVQLLGGGGVNTAYAQTEEDWNQCNDGSDGITKQIGNDPDDIYTNVPTNVYYTGTCLQQVLLFRPDYDNATGWADKYSNILDTTKFFAIVATGGGGPGSGDNLPPYWSDDQCDWIHAVREVVKGDCYDPIPSGNYGPRELGVLGCPTGPTIEIRLSELLTANNCIWDPVPPLARLKQGKCYGVNWACCISGASTGTGCADLNSRGALYTFNDYVCYGSGTGEVPGATGQNWIINTYPVFSGTDGEPLSSCSWTYDLQYYNPRADVPGYPGPSGTLQTGIAEIAISTGCADSYPY